MYSLLIIATRLEAVKRELTFICMAFAATGQLVLDSEGLTSNIYSWTDREGISNGLTTS